MGSSKDGVEQLQVGFGRNQINIETSRAQAAEEEMNTMIVSLIEKSAASEVLGQLVVQPQPSESTTLRHMDLVPKPQRRNKALLRRLRKTLVVTPADPDQAFTSLLRKPDLKVRKGNNLAEFALWGIGFPAVPAFLVSGLVTVITSGMFAFHGTDLAHFQSIISVFGPITGASAVLGGNAIRAGVSDSRSDKELYELAAKRFVDWLRLRHKIEVNPEQLGRFNFFDMLVTGENYNGSRIFTAVDGRQYKLVQDEDGTLHVEQHEVKKNAKKKGKRKKAKALAVASRQLESKAPFTGEASVLFTEVRSLIAKLTIRELAVEDEHIFRRAREDLTQLVALNDGLHELDGPGEQEEAHFKKILLALREELRGVVDRQRALIANEVAVTAEYVKIRRSTPSKLVLEPGTGTSEGYIPRLSIGESHIRTCPGSKPALLKWTPPCPRTT